MAVVAVLVVMVLLVTLLHIIQIPKHCTVNSKVNFSGFLQICALFNTPMDVESTWKAGRLKFSNVSGSHIIIFF